MTTLDIYSKKPDEAFPYTARDQLHLLSIRKTPGNAHIVGSYAFRFQKYAADIDMIEEYDVGSSQKYVIDSFYKKFKAIVQKVVKSRIEWFSEVKCGYDQRYDIKLGKCFNGRWLVKDGLGSELTALFQQGLIDKEDMEIVAQVLVPGKPMYTSDDYDIIKFIVKKYGVVRWSAAEIIKGWKIHQKQKFTFKEGLAMDTVLKIDVITKLEGKYVETTNIYFLGYHKDGMIVKLQHLAEIRESLKGDIEKLYFSDMWYSPFKCVKRMFSLCAIVQPELDKIAPKIAEIAGGDISSLYAIKSELDTIVLLLEKPGGRNAIAGINQGLDDRKDDISNILFLSNEDVIMLCKMIDKIVDVDDINKKSMMMETLAEQMGTVINNYTIEALNMIGMNPPLRELLPEEMTYPPTVVRSLDTVVKDPIHQYGGVLGVDHFDRDSESAFKVHSMMMNGINLAKDMDDLGERYRYNFPRSNY